MPGKCEWIVYTRKECKDLTVVQCPNEKDRCVLEGTTCRDMNIIDHHNKLWADVLKHTQNDAGATTISIASVKGMIDALKLAVDVNVVDTNQDGKIEKSEMVPFYMWLSRLSSAEGTCQVSFVKDYATPMSTKMSQAKLCMERPQTQCV